MPGPENVMLCTFWFVVLMVCVFVTLVSRHALQLPRRPMGVGIASRDVPRCCGCLRYPPEVHELLTPYWVLHGRGHVMYPITIS